MKLSYILFFAFYVAIFVHSTDTFDDDGLTFQEDTNSTLKNETDTEGGFFDVTIVETDESI